MEENIGSSCQSLENQTLTTVPMSVQEFKEISEIQQEMLQMVADGVRQDTILLSLCKLSESLLPNSVASIMMKDDATGLLNVISAPSIPNEGINALKCLKPGPGGGSCGNAVFNNKAQFVKDTFTDER